MKAVILGTTGYTGQVLLRLLGNHPNIEQIYPVSSSNPGQALAEMDPGLGDRVLEKTAASGSRLVDIQAAVAAKPDVVFAALPHLKSAEVCDPFFGSTVVIDLSADFRIADPEIFFQAYKQAPPRPELLDKAVYGLSEWMESELASADLIANPGCYPTATLLPLLPLVAGGFVDGDVIVNALSGISGAGRKAADNYLFSTRTENANAYSPGTTHRHAQEMQQEIDRWLGKAAPGSSIGSGLNPAPGASRPSTSTTSHATSADTSVPKLFFTPHLIPMKQGEFVTTSLRLKAGVTDAQIDAVYTTAYSGRPWVRRVPHIPQTAQVRGTNRCDFTVHREGDRVFLMSVIDNLYKGASGQAVQNMNIRFGFDQTAGLPMDGDI